MLEAFLARFSSEPRVRYGFHRVAGVNRRQYEKSLPQLGDPRPGKFNIFVETRIPWQKQAELARFIVELDDPSKVGTWPDGPVSFDDRRKEKKNGELTPYVVQIDNGIAAKGKTWESVYKEMKKKDGKKEEGGFKTERGATILEGIAFAIAYPEMLDEYRIVLPGSSYDLYDIVEIHKNERGKVVISHVFVGDTNTDHLNSKRISAYKRLPFAVLYSTRQSLAKAA